MLLATRSAGKIRELRPLLLSRGIGVISLDDAGIAESDAEDALEVYSTFEENALAKARYFARLSGRPTLADDSGLAVDALNGRPGVVSKRWSGRLDLSGQALDDENNRLLLEALRAKPKRHAHYVCAAAYADNSRELVARGEVHGHILETANGLGGFGYDPYFFAEELGKSFGDASRDEKATVSHRARAFVALMGLLRVDGIGRRNTFVTS
ncbi:MAG TPA: non-canonical purine NTP pyrophosphatase [Gemmatimonadaceae bacterium]|jgi:XTP/dITP diphosphohydrolase